MKIKTKGVNADLLKRQAKKLSKSSGITHTEALQVLAKEQGHANWESLMGGQPLKPKVKPQRPLIPIPAVLDYHNMLTGAVIGQHPNRKMTVRRHTKVGDCIKELLDAVEFHKMAKRAVEDIRRTMDLWLACEYNESELPNVLFNPIYYGSYRRISYGYPSVKRREELKRELRAARAIIDRSYHDCKPLDKLHQQFDKALKTLEKWPLSIKTPGSRKRKLLAGTFVRLDQDDIVGIVFNHDTRTEVVTGYTDAGHFMAGSHEVTLLKKQPSLKGFRPMRLYLPYGKWTCADGREVLFNRDYSPIWQRSADGIVSAIEPDTYINYAKSEHYYNDGSVPYRDNEETLNKCLAVLQSWNVAGQYPALFDRLPEAIAKGDVRLLSPRGMS